MKKDITSEQAMREFGIAIGQHLRGGEVIELVGDVGAGKTTLTKGIAEGLGVDEDVQSPSFTISRTYRTGCEGVILAHYDFYRLSDPGIMADELGEVLYDKGVVTIVEWAEIVDDILPSDRVSVIITPTSETARHVVIKGLVL